MSTASLPIRFPGNSPGTGAMNRADSMAWQPDEGLKKYISGLMMIVIPIPASRHTLNPCKNCAPEKQQP